MPSQAFMHGIQEIMDSIPSSSIKNIKGLEGFPSKSFRVNALLFFELNQVDKDFVWSAALLAEALGAP
jgi:hypothetical protein